jgi:hypothetical protein
MKKGNYLIWMTLLLLFVWANSCQSPSSTGQPAGSVVSKSNSSSGSNSDSSTKNSMGFLKLIIKDAPVDNAEKVFVTIDMIRVHQACATENEEICFIPVWENAAGTEFDLLQMKYTPLNFTTTLPAGKYNQIRMSVLSGRIVLSGGPAYYPLDVPSDEIKIHYQFEVPAGGTAQITLDFDAAQSLHIVKTGKKDSYKLRPVVTVVGFQQGTGS